MPKVRRKEPDRTKGDCEMIKLRYLAVIAAGVFAYAVVILG